MYNSIIKVYFVLTIFVLTSITYGNAAVTPFSQDSPEYTVRWTNLLALDVDHLNNEYLYNITDPVERHKQLKQFWNEFIRLVDVNVQNMMLRSITLSITRNEFNTINMQKIKNSLNEYSAIAYLLFVRLSLGKIYSNSPTQYNEALLLNMIDADPIDVRIIEYAALLGVHVTSVLKEFSVRGDDEFALSFIDKIKGIQSNEEYQQNSDKYEINLEVLINFFPESLRYENFNTASAITNAAQSRSLDQITYLLRKATDRFQFYKSKYVTPDTMTKLWIFEFDNNANDKSFYLKDILFKDFMMINDAVTYDDKIYKMRGNEHAIYWEIKDSRNLNAYKWTLEYDQKYQKCYFKNVKYNNEVLVFTYNRQIIYTLPKNELTDSNRQEALFSTPYCHAN